MRKTVQALVVSALASLLGACATPQPPERIREAIATMDAYMPEYIGEANAALESGGHPDAERLTGIGVRLRDGMDALNSWANDEGASAKGDDQ